MCNSECSLTKQGISAEKLTEQVYGQEERDVHYVCCKREEEAICGSPLQGREIDGEYSTCVPCVELDEMYPAGFCYGFDVCVLELHRDGKI